jgi:antitoxin ParD1/3/4
MAGQTNLNVSLTRRFVDLVRDRVESGRYQSASEVIREGLRLLEERDRGQEIYWAAVREKVAEGEAQLRAGSGIPAEAFKENMRGYVQQVKARSKGAKSSRGDRKS